MGAIFLAQWRQLARSPWAFLAMTAMTLLLAAVMGQQATSMLQVTVLPDADLDAAHTDAWLERLGESQAFKFKLGDEKKTLDRLRSGGSGLVLRLGSDSWRVQSAGGSESAAALANFVARTYREQLTLEQAAAGRNATELAERVADELKRPALTVQTVTATSAASFAYDGRVQAAFGMGLFFVMFTILFGVNNLLEERRLGLWDRVIVSPVSKAGMYAGHVTFSFLSGMLQLVLVFGLFRVAFGVSTGPKLVAALLVLAAFAFAITALGMVLAGLVGNAAQMNIAIPIVAVSSAMIGGAFWPIEIVTNPVMLALSRVLPLRPAMDALKGLAYHGWGLTGVLGAVGYLAAFALVCMVVGLWLVDRRSS